MASRFLLCLWLFCLNIIAFGAQPLIYLNNPEMISHPGNIFRQDVINGTRIFIHLVNGTRKTQLFTVQGANEYHVGLSTDIHPADAGFNGLLSFYTHTQHQAAVRIPVLPGETISGFIDIFCTPEHCLLIINLGDGNSVGEHAIVSDAIITTHCYLLRNMTYKYTVGCSTVINGDYGVEHRYSLISFADQPARISISASLRGGDGRIIFLINGKVFKTPFLKAKSHIKLATYVLHPGKELIFCIIPIGGQNYPLALNITTI